MSAEQLITKHIDLWTSTIKARNTQGRGSSKKRELYGIKKLRELILELAVRGKLVAQDPNDEPASALLESIAIEKARFINDKIIKKSKQLPKITEEEKPFDSPVGWEWIRLADAGRDLGQKEPINDFTYIDVGCINKELGVVAEPKVLSADDAPSRARKIVKKGTVIYSTVRPYLLNIAVINDDFHPEPIASTAFAILHPYSGLAASFIYRYLRSPTFIAYVESVQTGIAYPAVNDKQFFSGILPIPPVQEQHRIVAKVDELMTLCDQLEQQTESSFDAHNLLVDTLLATLTNARDAKELSDNWARFMATDDLTAGNAGAISASQSVFDTLITTDYAVEQLKQTILQLAIQGKLVPQDPSDEPASELLKRIAAEKEQLIKDKKIKKQKPLPKITDEEKPFELPFGWEWTKVGNVSLLKGGFAYKSKEFSTGSDFQVIRMGNIRPDYFRLNENPVFITSESAENTTEYKITEKDILLTMTGTKGKRDYLYSLVVKRSDIETRNLYLNQRLCIVRPLEVNELFLSLVIKNDVLLDFIYEKSTGTANQANIGMDAIMNWAIPIPSLTEQHRIVTKVNELITLCDQVKAQLNNARTTQLHLTDSVIDNALSF
ncbi:MAG: restriction endonuclease subunit S [SAR86 cluster bacterium]|uniref:Restriction endonuclease subunit S n=1 Tax=SAR86 cluster bacterium TaxID=2030880 RepID=A0A2A5B585_9GAMM|nr:MAG: restriction endonuclease subunit S [SAR86 cluster bacterium]